MIRTMNGFVCQFRRNVTGSKLKLFLLDDQIQNGMMTKLRLHQAAVENETKISTHRDTGDKPHSDLLGVIGLEIHAQIASNTKLFSGSPNKFSGAVNSNVSYFDCALPGTLPVLNRKCVMAGVKTALALNCHIQKVSKFDRKHYFYADLPAGYQITQQRKPLAINGKLNYVVYNPSVYKVPFEKSARITQVQLEQDSGKSLHDTDGNYSLIDLNRAGTGLMEIVTEADFRNGEEAAAFVKELHNILTLVGTCDGKMAEGSLRVDANISVHRSGEPFGIRTEVKNINSMRNVAKAVEFEIERQKALIECGKCVVNETRSFDMESGETVAMRDKEIKQDYRFMPEPNLPPLRLYDNSDCVEGVNSNQVINIDTLRSSLPELPSEKRLRFQSVYKLSLENCVFFVKNKEMGEYFEGIMDMSVADCHTVVKVLKAELQHFMIKKSMPMENCPFSVQHLADISKMVQDELISKNIIFETLELLTVDTNQSVSEVVTANNLFQISDVELLTTLCKNAVNDNPSLVKRYRSGKTKYLSNLVNKVMKKTDNKASIKITFEVLKNLLNK